MSLPKLSIPTYNVNLPSTGKKILMKSLTAKEFKLLLVAKESDSTDQMVVTMKQLLRNCIQDAKVDVNKMYVFDAEYLFIHMMTASTAERRPTLQYKCKNVIADEEGHEKICAHVNQVIPDLHAGKIDMPGKTECTIEADTESGEKIIITFRFPTLGDIEDVMASSDPMAIIASCMTSVATEETVSILGRDYSLADAISFVSDLTDEVATKIDAFFKTVPKLQLEHKFKCKGCGFEHEIKLEGIKDFFM